MQPIYDNLSASQATYIPELFQQALRGDPDAKDDQSYNHAIATLSGYIETIFPQIREMLSSGDISKRRVALAVIDKYASGNDYYLAEWKPTRSECHELVVSILNEGNKLDSSLIPVIIHLLATVRQPGWIEIVLPFVTDPDPRVRYSVALAFRRGNDEREVRALVLLSEDPIELVRSCAVIMIAIYMKQINERACDALANRLNDRAADIKMDAICGLVKARDPRAIEPLREQIKNDALEGLIRRLAEDVCYGKGYDEKWTPVFRDLAILALKKPHLFSDEECLKWIAPSELDGPEPQYPSRFIGETEIQHELGKRINQINGNNPEFVNGQLERLIAIGKVQLYARPLEEWSLLVSYLGGLSLPPLETITYEDFPHLLASKIPEPDIAREIAEEEPWEAYLLWVMIETFCKDRAYPPRFELYFPVLGKSD